MRHILTFLIMVMLLSIVVDASSIIVFTDSDAGNFTDVYVAEDDPNTALNANGNLNTGLTGGAQARRSLFQFSWTCTSIPAESVIDNVTLAIVHSSDSVRADDTVSGFILDFNQTEGSVTWNNCVGGAGCTWNATNVVTAQNTPISDAAKNISILPSWYVNMCRNETRSPWIIIKGVEAGVDLNEYYDSSDATPAKRPRLIVGFTESAPGGTPDDPVFVNPTPVHQDHDNINITINVTNPATDITYNLFISDADSDNFNHILQDAPANATGFSQYITTFSVSGGYEYIYNVKNTTSGLYSNNVSRNYSLDTIKPIITVNAATNFSTSNLTIVSPNVSSVVGLDVTFFDNNLFAAVVNVTHSNGTVLFSYSNTSINTTTANVSTTIDFIDYLPGNYTVKLIASDDHTMAEIGNYRVNKLLDRLSFSTETDNEITVKSLTLPMSVDSEKKRDRYEFEFDYLFLQNEYSYVLESKHNLHYIENSKYNGHFVSIDSEGKGNWIDFERNGLLKKHYTITKINDKSYRIDIKSNGEKNIKFRSIGGLNTKEVHYLIKVGARVEFLVKDDSTNGRITATGNYSGQITHTTESVLGELFNVTADKEELIINASDYTTTSFFPVITDQYHNFSYELQLSLGLRLTFFDEITETPIEAETFTVFLSSNNFSNTYNPVNSNPYTISDIKKNDYDIKVGSTNYGQRELIDIAVPGINLTNISIYLVNNSLGQQVTFNVLDVDSEPIEDARLKFQKIIGNNYSTVGEEETDFAGQVVITLYENTDYQIIANHSEYVLKTLNLEPHSTSYNIFLDQESTVIAPIVDIIELRGLDVNLSYINSSQTVSLSYNVSNSSTVQEVCLSVFDTVNNFSYVCSSSDNATLTFVIPDQNTSVVGQAVAITTNRNYVLDSLTVNLMKAWQTWGRDALMFSFVIILVSSLIGLSAGPAGAVVGADLGISMSFLFGFLPIGVGVLFLILFVSIFAFVGLKK